jgi:hypothetical protein
VGHSGPVTGLLYLYLYSSDVTVRKQNGVFISTGDRIKKNEMGGEYGTYCGEEKCIQDIGWET